jgi:hypothetical protein
MDDLAGALHNSKKSTGKQPQSKSIVYLTEKDELEDSLIQSEQFISFAVECDKNQKKFDNAVQIEHQQVGTDEKNLEPPLVFHEEQEVEKTDNQSQVQSNVTIPIKTFSQSNNEDSQSGDDGSKPFDQQ